LVPNDWATFLRSRLDSHGPGAPLQGIERSGWRLVFRDTPSPYLKKVEELSEGVNRTFSVGLALDKEAKLNQVVWDSPAYKAGLTTGTTLIAVNGVAYRKELLDQALIWITSARSPSITAAVRVIRIWSASTVDRTGWPIFSNPAPLKPSLYAAVHFALAVQDAGALPQHVDGHEGTAGCSPRDCAYASRRQALV
jgi:hypothetical protein